jgi:VWFA-related protein
VIRLAPFAAAALLTCAAAAQAPPPGSGQPFRAGIDVTTIDLTVVDRDGNPIRDLTPHDIVVTVDGKPRTILSAQFVAAVAESTAPAASARPSDYATNEPTAPGRLIAIVVDQDNIRQGGEKSAMRAAEGFLDRLTPADRVALFTISTPSRLVPFTGDRNRIKDALRHVVGQYSVSAGLHNIAATEALAIEDGDADVLEKVIERECGRGDRSCPQTVQLEARGLAPDVRRRADDTLRALSRVLAYLKSIEGPKTMALVSEGLVLDQVQFPMGVPRELEALAAQSRVTVYVLRLASASFDASEAKPVRAIDVNAQTEGLETIAGVTGGDVLTVAGTGASIFDRIARETSGYYLVGIETSDQDRDGKPHRIKATVRRARVEVRARREFRVEPEATTVADASPAAAILAALRAPLPISGVPIRIGTYVLHDANPRKVRLVVSTELGEGFSEPVRVGVGYELLDADGNVVAGHAGPITLAAGADGRLRYREEFAVAPGPYTFKLAAADAAGHVGSIDRAIDAALTRIGPIAAADLVLNDARDAVRGTALDVHPTVASGALAAVLDMKTVPGAMPENALVSFELLDGGGAPVRTAPAEVASSSDGVRHVAKATIDVAGLPPAEYLARAVVTIGPAVHGEVSRAFRIVR